MKKRFIENLGFFLVLNLIIKPIYVFGIDRVVQNTVGTEVYGSYFALFNLVIIFQIFLDLGIENFTRKEIASNPGLTNRLFSNFIVLKVLLVVLFICFFSLAGLFLPQSKDEWKILFILLVNQSLANFILFLRANLGGLQMFKTESLVSVLDRMFMVLFCGALLILPLTKGSFKIEWFVYTQTLAYLFTLIFSLVVLLQKTGIPKLQWRITPYLPVVKQLLPYATLVLLMAFYYRVDSVFLRYLLPDGKEQAGIFAHAFRILDFMSNYALIFSFILLPTFAKMIREKTEVVSLLRMALLALCIPSLAFLAGILFYRHDVFMLLYHEHVHVSASVFSILIISYLGICVSYTFGALLTANGNLRQLNTMAFFAVIISLVLNMILIPRYKVMGAAITNAAVQCFTIAYHVIVVSKKFRVKTDYRLISRILIFITITGIFGFFISKTSVAWIYGIIIIDMFALLLAILIKLINLKAFVNLMLSKATN